MSTSRKLPPTERDFDIYEAVHIAGYPIREQAEKYGISQTRVRQIVRRVIEWLGEVIPPQAKVAKEQQSHLARQIAADRFNLQYTEASTNWYQSGDLKFAGLRIRLTHAGARLGVPGSLIGGLAADAIEGLDVPAYQRPQEREHEAIAAGRHEPRAETPLVPSVPAGNARTGGSSLADPELAPPPNPHSPAERPELSQRQIRAIQRQYPWLFQPLAFSEISPEIVADREAVGVPFPPPLIRSIEDYWRGEATHYFDGLPLDDDDTNDAYEKLENLKSWIEALGLAPAPAAELPSSIDSLNHEPRTLNPQSASPPNEDCSPCQDDPQSVPPAADSTTAETNDSTSTCANNIADNGDGKSSPNTTAQPLFTSDVGCVESAHADETHHAASQPMLTTGKPLPVTELELTPHEPGATISEAKNRSAVHSAPVPVSPCPPVS